MTAKRDLKRRIRERQARTGESYTTARRHVLAAREDTTDSTGQDATGDTPASPFEGDEVTDPGATQPDADARALVAKPPAKRVDPPATATGSRFPDEMKLSPSDPASPIDVDEALDFTEAAAELGMKCRVLMFERLVEQADPARVLVAVRDTLAATEGDPATELLRRLVFRGEAPGGRVVLTREPRFRQRVEAGLTGVSSDGRILAVHIEGHHGIVTALCALWRNMATLVLMAPDETVARLVLPPGTITELAERQGVRIAPAPVLYLLFNGRRYPITREPFVIGRHARSDLQIKDGHISRKHAAVLYRQGAHYLVDLGSQARIEYRGLKIENKRIEEGDMFRIRDYVLRFTYLETDG